MFGLVKMTSFTKFLNSISTDHIKVETEIWLTFNLS